MPLGHLIRRTGGVLYERRPKKGTSARAAWDFFAERGPVLNLALLDGYWGCYRTEGGDLEEVEAIVIFERRMGYWGKP